MPLSLWEIGRRFRGEMLAIGWTPAQFERRIEQYRLDDLLLTLNPKMAHADTTREAMAPVDHRPANLRDAPSLDDWM